MTRFSNRSAGFGAAVIGWLALGPANAAAPFDLNGGTWAPINPPQMLRTIDNKAPPLLPDAEKLYQQHLAERKDGDLSFDNTEKCLPPGLPRLLTMSGGFEVLQTPTQIIFLYQWNRLMRMVDMNMPQRQVIGPTFDGQSVGNWDGGKLVVDSIAFSDDTLLDSAGLPHSDALHVTEQYSASPDEKFLTDLITIDDPKDYATPWQTKLSFRHIPDGSITEDVCLERKGIKWGDWRNGT